MVDFDNEKTGYQHTFIRTDADMLNQLFGDDSVTPFWIADMDFEVAKPITDELQRLVDRGIYAYEFDAEGVFNAIAEWNQRRHGITLAPSSLIQVPGVLTGIAILIRELTEPGDRILVQTPVYHQFAKVIGTAGRAVLKNPLRIVGDRYEMDFEDLEHKLKNDKPALILLCNPHNPVGRVWTKNELDQVVDLADRYNVTIVSDEVHSDIVYAGHPFNCVASLATNNRHISLIGSPAKTFGMQSISNGYIYIPNEHIRKRVFNVVDSMYLNHGNAFTMFATIAAYQKGDEWLDQLLSYLQSNVNWMNEFIASELPSIRAFPVEGTYQMWLDFSSMCDSPKTLKELLVQKAQLGLTPGSWFEPDNALFMRMNFASPLSKVQGALSALKGACSS
ncbi:MAG: PatB family C-S lyase [Cyanobacteria bacterium P01_F01_bin.150]